MSQEVLEGWLVPAEGAHRDARTHQFAVHPWRLVIVDVQAERPAMDPHPLGAK